MQEVIYGPSCNFIVSNMCIPMYVLRYFNNDEIFSRLCEVSGRRTQINLISILLELKYILINLRIKNFVNMFI